MSGAVNLPVAPVLSTPKLIDTFKDNLDEGLSYERVREDMGWCDSYSRLPHLLDLLEYMGTRDGARTLGEWWTSFDNIAQHKAELLDYFRLCTHPRRGGAVLDMMTSAELAQLAALPYHVVVYRGADANNLNGLSWSLRRDVASRFPFLNRYRAKQPVLVTAMVSRRSIRALKLDRGEAEVICYRPTRMRVQPLVESQVMLKEKAA